MNVPSIDENVYVRSLQYRDIPRILDVAHLTTKIAMQSDLILFKHIWQRE